MKKTLLLGFIAIVMTCTPHTTIFAQNAENWKEIFTATFPLQGGSHTNTGLPNAEDALDESAYTEYMQKGECANLYAADGAIRVGTPNQKSLLTFIPANLTGEKIKITMKVKGVDSPGNIVVRLKEGEQKEEVPFTSIATDEWQEVSVMLEGGDFDSQLQISPKGEGFLTLTFTPFYLQSITVQTMGGEEIPTTPTIYTDPDVEELVFDDREVGESTFATTIKVKAFAMNSAPTYQIEPEKEGEQAFSATGELTEKGGNIEIKFTPETKGLAYARLIIKGEGLSDRVFRLKGRGLGASPLTDINLENTTAIVEENFDNLDQNLPEGWSEFIERGYQSWAPMSIEADGTTQKVMGINAYKSGYDLATSILRTPVMTKEKGDNAQMEITFCIPPSDVLFSNCFMDIFYFYDIKSETEYKVDTLFSTEEKEGNFETPQKLLLDLPRSEGKYVVAIRYRGAGTSDYSRLLYIDNVKISVVSATKKIEDAARPLFVRMGNKISYTHAKAQKIRIYTLDGVLISTHRIHSESGEIVLPEKVGNVVVFSEDGSIVL